jgi:Protein of unknown function (DUF3034)
MVVFDRRVILMGDWMKSCFAKSCSVLVCSVLWGSAAGAAGAAGPDQGKLLATGGVSQVEGAGGGGLVPWALITGYGSVDSYGANLHTTRLRTQDYSFRSWGMAVGWRDRFEVSLATQELDGHLAPFDALRLKQDILGLKMRVAGDAVYDQDRWLPQIAVGLQYKRNHAVTGIEGLGVTNVKQLGAAKDRGLDFNLSATKLFLAQSMLLNGNVRLTRANQFGLLGFGGDKHNQYQARFEFSAAWLISRHWVAGVEYRMRPQNLKVDNEKDAYDAFVAWFPNKNVSLTAAWVNLGDITTFNPKRQHGWYLSLQTGF